MAQTIRNKPGRGGWYDGQSKSKGGNGFVEEHCRQRGGGIIAGQSGVVSGKVGVNGSEKRGTLYIMQLGFGPNKPKGRFLDEHSMNLKLAPTTSPTALSTLTGEPR